MIGEIISVLTSGAAGGIVGTVGSLFKKRQERKTLEVQNKHELAMAELGLKEREAEAKYAAEAAAQERQMVQIEGDQAIEVAHIGAFEASQKAALEISSHVPRWVNGIRALMRPAITLALLVFQGVIMYYGIESEEAFRAAVVEGDGMLTTLSSLSFLTNMAVSWWFGSRSSSAK